MSAKLEIVGNLADPKRAQSRDGKAILNLSVGHTPRRKNRDTGEWEDAGDTLWVRAAWFGDEADLIGSQVAKGMRVRIEGEPQMSVREHEGRTYTNLELRWPSITFLPQRQQGYNAGSAPSAGEWSSPPVNGAQNASWASDPNAPF